MEITPLGDSAVVVRVYDDFASNPEAALEAVLNAQQRLEAAAIPSVVEYVAAYDSIGLFFDPAGAIEAGASPDSLLDWLKKKIFAALAKPIRANKKRARSALLEIPVCYDPEYAPDLGEVARRGGLSIDEAVRLHRSAEYRVHCVGFVPGFPYLGGLPAELASPRRANPRKLVSAGSVAIGGAQTGVYPIASPGGWNLIGRTPLRLFDPQRVPPALAARGDRVRFRSISRTEFDSWTE